MGDDERLVGEFLSVNRLATGAVAGGEVTALEHEVLDAPVEGGALVSEAGLAGAELAEVLDSLRHLLAEEGEGDATGVLAADGHVEVDLRRDGWGAAVGGGGRRRTHGGMDARALDGSRQAGAAEGGGCRADGGAAHSRKDGGDEGHFVRSGEDGVIG